MSTISTHLNWGASYVVQDFYRRFVVTDRHDRHYLLVARLATVGLIVLAMLLSLWLETAVDAFRILLQIGAGTGLVFLLRWFWWRVNAWSEIAGMVISFLIAVYFQFVHVRLGFAPVDPSLALLIGVAITTLGWVTVTLLTPPADRATLQMFYDRIRPFGAGWKRVVDVGSGPAEGPAAAALCWFLGCVTVYATLFGTGNALYGRPAGAALGFVIAVGAAVGLFRVLPRVRFE
jgi:Na+/proline symporter